MDLTEKTVLSPDASAALQSSGFQAPAAVTVETPAAQAPPVDAGFTPGAAQDGQPSGQAPAAPISETPPEWKQYFQDEGQMFGTLTETLQRQQQYEKQLQEYQQKEAFYAAQFANQKAMQEQFQQRQTPAPFVPKTLDDVVGMNFEALYKADPVKAMFGVVRGAFTHDPEFKKQVLEAVGQTVDGRVKPVEQFVGNFEQQRNAYNQNVQRQQQAQQQEQQLHGHIERNWRAWQAKTGKGADAPETKAMQDFYQKNWQEVHALAVANPQRNPFEFCQRMALADVQQHQLNAANTRLQQTGGLAMPARPGVAVSTPAGVFKGPDAVRQRFAALGAPESNATMAISALQDHGFTMGGMK